MIRLVVLVAGVVVGAVGTLVVQPKKVAQKVRAAAAFAMKKIRQAYEAGEPKQPGDGPTGMAA